MDNRSRSRYLRLHLQAALLKKSEFDIALIICYHNCNDCVTDTCEACDRGRTERSLPLMGGYKHLFRIPLTKNYKPGTFFEEIVALYEFDADLRELVFRYLLQIERHVRSLISYYLQYFPNANSG